MIESSGRLNRFRGNQEVDWPFCGPEPSSLLLVDNGFRIVRCDQCELLYVNPWQSPLYGSLPFRLFNWCSYRFTTGIYSLTRGWGNIVPKEFLVYGKALQ